MRKLTHSEIKSKRFTPEELKSADRFPIYALVDNVRSLYNVGSIFRTSDAARLSKLFLCGFTPHPPRKEIEKTALGATETVPWEDFKSPAEAVESIKQQGIRLCVVEHTDKSVPYYSLTPSDFPLCLAVGNELTGLSKEVISQADFAIDIPMFGLKQSLNVSVAYGIVLYHCVSILKK